MHTRNPAVSALQLLLAYPATFQHFVLASPSVCFDPEILEDVSAGAWAEADVRSGIRVLVLLGERERGKASGNLSGNVHTRMGVYTDELVKTLKQVGVQVAGAFDIPQEDHSSVKFSVISRGLGWFVDTINQERRDEKKPGE